MLRVVLEFLLIFFVARSFWRVVGGVIQGITGQPPTIPQRGAQMVRDPICGTFVLPERAIVLTDGHDRVYFCSTDCRDKYLVDRRGPRPVDRKSVV